MLPLLCAAFMGGIVLAGLLSPPFGLLAGITVLLFMISGGAFFLRRQAAVTILLAAAFLSLGMLNASLAREEIHSSLTDYLGREVFITGHVNLVEDVADESCAFIFRVEEIAEKEGAPALANALVRVKIFLPPAGFTPYYGQRLRLGGQLLAPAAKRNPGGFDYASYLEAAGVGAVLSVSGRSVEQLAGRGGHFAAALAENLRGRVISVLNHHLPAAEAGLAAGLLLGTRKYLEQGTAEAYHVLGIAHLLAASGLHVGFVVAFALLLIKRLRLTSRTGILPGCLIVLAYVILTGGRPSVWRAALMLGMGLIARQYGREADMLQGLSAAALILLIIRPLWLFSLSFQLSFLATLGILVLAPGLQKIFSRVPKSAVMLLATTVSAQLAVLPLQAMHFSFIPLLAVPVNLVFVPLVGLVMMLGLAGMMAGLAYLPLAAPFYLAVLPVLHVLEKLPRLLADFPLAALRVHLPPAVWLVYTLGLALLAAGTRLHWTRGRRLLAVLLLVNMVLWGNIAGARAPGMLEVSFIDVGQGLSVFIRTEQGRTMLVDAGGGRGSGFDPGERIVVPFLRQRRVKSLDMLVLTHPHADHYGGMAAVVKNFDIKCFVGSGEREDSLSFAGLMELLQARGVEEATLSAGDRIILDAATSVRVLSPPVKKISGTSGDTNNNSLVMLLEYGSFRLLITGDAEREALILLVDGNADLDSTVLQVPHHGSRHALFDAFLEAVRPQAAVIPVGYNTFGHPHAETLNLLSLYVPCIYRTDTHGAVTFYSDGAGWDVHTFTGLAKTK
ncbi:MAG: DNA internalization-related competence protein ComEC/Rec2 [Dethiobacter sp.]|nr:DNA internalization-related competence protein ComEC/Rec2 [Dethiobacter sp.]